MILHSVFCNFLPDCEQAWKLQIFGELKAFSETLSGVTSFEFGPNRDFENKSADYSDGFIIKFTDAAALHTYATHETHMRLGAELCALCVGGADGIMVFDIETT